MTRLSNRAQARRWQQGASAVEFAFVFPVLFLLVYGVIVYSYVYVIQQSITYTAQHSAEAAVSVDPNPSATLDARITTQVRALANAQLSWLPANQQARVLGAAGAGVLVQFSTVNGSDIVQVTLKFDLVNLFPTLVLPFVGSIPPLPTQLQAQAIARI